MRNPIPASLGPISGLRKTALVDTNRLITWPWSKYLDALPGSQFTFADASTPGTLTAGLQEAINGAPAGSLVIMPSGTTAFTATVRIQQSVTVLFEPCSITGPASGPIISIESSGVSITGSSSSVLTQQVAGTTAHPNHGISNTFNGVTTAVSDVEISGLKLVGVSGTSYVGGNNGIDIKQGSRVNVHDCTFTGWQLEAVKVQNSSDVQVNDNLGYGLCGGIRFIGVQRFKCCRNTIRDTSQSNANLAIPYAVDSVSGTGFSNTVDFLFEANQAINYVNSQAFLIHDGSRGVIAGNVADNISNLVSVDPFASPDACLDLVIANNSAVATTTSASQTANNGIAVNGNPGLIAAHIAVKGNVLYGFNSVLQSNIGGAYLATFCDDVIFDGNLANGTYGSGLVWSSTATRVAVLNNQFTDIQAASGIQAGVYVTSAAVTGSGWICNNVVDGASWGLRFDTSLPGILYGFNKFSNLTGVSDVITPGNATPLTVFDGNLTIGGTDATMFSPLVISGDPTKGRQIIFGTVNGVPESAYGVGFSSGAPVVSANAKQVADNTDNWTQVLGSVGSALVTVDQSNGLRFCFAANGKANGNFATFWGTPLFQVDTGGEVYFQGIPTSTTATGGANAVPANCDEFITVRINGVAKKVACFAP